MPSPPSYRQLTANIDWNVAEQELAKPDTVEQVLEARVLAQGIKIGMHLEKLQDVGLLLVSPLQPGKCLFLVAQA